MRKKIVAGNWKMNKTLQAGMELANELKSAVVELEEDQEVILIPPFIHLASLQNLLEGSLLKTGAQNNHMQTSGAYTGEVSANMLKSVGVSYGLVGHSERRTYNAESDEQLLAKTKALLQEGIEPIFCCGESLEDRKGGKHFEVVEQQLDLLWNFNTEDFQAITIAYEPVWAIGTGETASSEQAQEMHEFIRSLIAKKMGAEQAESTSILYGGSCKADNAKELFSKADVDGGLIGGAALESESFLAIIAAMSS